MPPPDAAIERIEALCGDGRQPRRAPLALEVLALGAFVTRPIAAS